MNMRLLSAFVFSLASFVAGYSLKGITGPPPPPYSDAVRAGDLLFLSGKVGTIPGSSRLAPGGIEAETRQALENVKRVLEANDSSLERVVKCTVMLADMKEWEAMNVVYRKYMPHRPARSTFGANGLAFGARVEIECIATAK